MRTLDELRGFYGSNLLPELKILEKQRIEAKNKILIAAGIVSLLAIFILFQVRNEDAAIFILILAVGIVVLVSFLVTKEYRASFKKGIIERIVNFIDENLHYSKAAYISQSIFVQSKIFLRHPDEYEGDDYVQGKIGETRLEFSEIHAKYVTHDSKGRRQVHTIFKGLFFVADFNKDFSRRTVVLPDTAERLFGQFGSMLQSMNKMRGQLIKLEDPEFEKIFAVYGDDQIEARYILSTSLMKRIVDFKKKTRRPIYISFVGSRVYVAISYTRNLFEPRIFTTLLDFDPIKQYFEDFQIAIGIVEDLNLNTRIWTKA